MFAARCKLTLDWLADSRAPRDSPYSNATLLTWFNKMGNSEKYNNLSMSELVRVESKTRRRNTSSEDAVPLPDDDEDYIFCGTPPPPTTEERGKGRAA